MDKIFSFEKVLINWENACLQCADTCGTFYQESNGHVSTCQFHLNNFNRSKQSFLHFILFVLRLNIWIYFLSGCPNTRLLLGRGQRGRNREILLGLPSFSKSSGKEKEIREEEPWCWWRRTTDPQNQFLLMYGLNYIRFSRAELPWWFTDRIR